MIACALVETVIAKIVSQDCRRREDLDDESSLFFSVSHAQGERTFAIPRPLKDGGYTLEHMEVIEAQMARIGLELLPLDVHLVH